MAQTTFEVDDATLAALAELKSKFGVKTNAQAIRKALALARVAVQNVAADNSVTFLAPGPDGEKQKVMLSA